MSATAKAVLDQFRELPVTEQRELLRQLLQTFEGVKVSRDDTFPTVQIGEGTITSQQVADALDDE